MIHDITRAALVIAVMAAGSALLVETRYQLVAIDAAHRNLVAGIPAQPMPTYVPQPEPGRLRQFGRSALDFADAALGIVR
jgi:hypothetical protein